MGNKLVYLNWLQRSELPLNIPKSSFSPLYSFNISNFLSISSQKELKFTDYNRIIHGDSLLGMAVLIDEGYAGQVQMIYIDPPFGIGYKADHAIDGERSEGYLDVWKNGLAGYLGYLRDRLALCRDLLTPTGSVFVQIGEENIHYVRCLLDEIFGMENSVSLITFRTAISTNNIQGVADYLLWFAKDRKQLFQRKLFVERPPENIEKTFTYKDQDGDPRSSLNFKPQELVMRIKPRKGELGSRTFAIIHNGQKYHPPEGFEWKFPREALEKLVEEGRIAVINGKLYGKRYLDDFPAMLLTNIWTDTSTSTFATKKHYTVHTNPKVIERCLAMTTRPSDLVLDPTSGSGTTAFCAEKLQRRWIVFDTSPSAVLSTMSMVLGNTYPTYLLAADGCDFAYQPLKKISLSQIAKDKEVTAEYRFDLPKIDKSDVRTAAPFIIEGISFDELPAFPLNIEQIKAGLKKNGICSASGSRIVLDVVINLELNQNKGLLKDCPSLGIIRVKIEQTWAVLIVIPPIKSDDFSSFSKQLSETIKKIANEYPQDFIVVGFWNPRLALISALYQCLQTSTAQIHSKLGFGLFHPDLFIKELDFSIHPEYFRLCGWINLDSSSQQYQVQAVNFEGSIENIPGEKLVSWFLYPLTPQNDNSLQYTFTISHGQLPYYSKYCSKPLRENFCSLPLTPKSVLAVLNAKKRISFLKSQKISVETSSKNDIFGILGFDGRGTPHFGIIKKSLLEQMELNQK
jgi:hypothetical protein